MAFYNRIASGVYLSLLLVTVLILIATLSNQAKYRSTAPDDPDT